MYLHISDAFSALFATEKSGKEVMSKGSSGMEVILASLEVSTFLNTTFPGSTVEYIVTL